MLKTLKIQLKRWFYKPFVSNRNTDWMFEVEFKYNFQFKISFPVTGGYRETGTINVVVPANNPQQAKDKLNKYVKDKLQVTVVNVKQSY